MDASRIAALRAAGVSWRAIAQELGIGFASLYRVRNVILVDIDCCVATPARWGRGHKYFPCSLPSGWNQSVGLPDHTTPSALAQ